MSSEMKSRLIKAPETGSKPLSRPVAAFLSLPLRFKITIPYLVVAILLAGLATWVITQSFLTKLQERFNVQLVDGFETASTQVFQSESKALITERSIARTIGVAEAVAVHDTTSLNALVRPLVINAHTPLVQILDNSGALVYGLRLTPEGNNIQNEAADFAAWPPVRRVLAGLSDDLGDKFSGVADAPGGPALYVAGPLILNNQRVGVVLVGFPLGGLLPQMAVDSVTQVTLYQPDGRAAFSTFTKGPQIPELTSEILTAVNAKGLLHVLQNRLWTVDRNEYNEAVGPLLVRGQPSGWALAVALPRALITSSARISPEQLAVAFALAVLAVIALGVVVAKIIAIPLFELVDASTRVAQGDLDAIVREHARDELGLLSRQFNHMVFQLRQREFMRDLFGRMVSEEVREALLLNQVHLGGDLKVVTVLFTDIRQFTTFSESHSPQEVVDMLNSYFSIVHSAVREAGGMINKFGGDSTMAIFGAPISLEPNESAHRALRAALSIRIRITEANAHRVQAGLEMLKIGIGINTGEVITGNIGAEDRFEYTVIGDAVNVAARMQSLTNQFTDSNIFITEATYQAFTRRERLLVVDRGAVALKGRTELVHVYNVIGMQLNNNTPQKAHLETPTQRNEVPRRDAFETVYLYCRGFDPMTIATTKNLRLDLVLSWIKAAALRFERSKLELSHEFALTETELQRLYDADRDGLSVPSYLESETQT
jgi:class 3 adenylate cyclase